MASWRSHLPDGLGAVTGLGMNSEEMADNSQLDDFVIHDVNEEPRLPFDDDSFDGCVCSVSVQYLVRPIEVVAELTRVVRAGGPIGFSFSNRCFPTKAVAVWLAGGDAHHRELVCAYLTRAGLADVHDEQLESGDDPIFLVWAPNSGVTP